MVQRASPPASVSLTTSPIASSQGQQQRQVAASSAGDSFGEEAGAQDATVEATGIVTGDSNAASVPPGCNGRELRVLYVFAGAAREGDLHHWLQRFRGRQGLEVREVDVVRGPGFDLSKARLRRQLLDEVRRGRFALVVASPPCSTFSRARYSGRPGPPPLRSAEFLRGFPRLNGRNRDRIARANLFVDFSVELLQA